MTGNWSPRQDEAAERARRSLPSAGEAVIELQCQSEMNRHNFTAEQFEAAAVPLLDRLKIPALRVRRDAEVNRALLARADRI